MFPCAVAGEAGSSPPLCLLLRRREGWGTPVLCSRRVNSRDRWSAGGAREVEASPGRIRLLLHRPLCAGDLGVSGEVLAAVGAPRSLDLGKHGLRPSVTSAPAVVSAAANKGVPDLLLLASWVVAVGGSGGVWSSQGCCSGGGDLEVELLLWFRRRGDACSGVVAEPRSLHRSFLLAALMWPASPGSSSLSGDGEGELFCCSTFSRFAGLQACWHGEAEDDDFPPASSSAETRFRRPGWCGGGEARPRLAPVFSVFRGPRDRFVIFLSFGVRCNSSCY